MVHVVRTFTVERPVDVVVTYLADFGNAAQWDPGTVECTRADDGPVAVGSTWNNTSKVLGLTAHLTYRLDRLDPGHVVFVGENTKGTATSTDDITVRPGAEGGTSEVTYDATIVFHGLAKVAEPVMRLEFEKLGNQTATGIQRAVAALPAASG
jgi:carbon monoxide dehydrogenase subunit G